MFTDELMEQKYAQTHKVSDALIVLFESVFDAGNKDKANSNAIIPTGKFNKVIIYGNYLLLAIKKLILMDLKIFF